MQVLLSLVRVLLISSIISSTPLVDIIIVAQVEYATLYSCINSLFRHVADTNLLQQRIILVDDNSPQETRSYLQSLCKEDLAICVATSKNNGEIKPIKLGLEAGKTLTGIESDTVVILNANTMVTEGWLTALYRGLHNGNPKTGIVGPISNSASFQSVPNISDFNTDGKIMGWSENKLPPGLDLDNLARKIRHFVHTKNVNTMRLNVLNGFCLMFRRVLLEEIGLFDEINFQKGYGEKVDFCIRTIKAGYENFIIPSSYVFQSSFFVSNVTMDAIYRKSGNNHLRHKYGSLFFNRFENNARASTELQDLRNFVANLYNTFFESYPNIKNNGSILFVLHDIAVAGGIVSVLQESLQMHKYGVKLGFSFPTGAADYYWEAVVKAILPGVSDATMKELIVEHQGKHVFPEVHPSFYEMAKSFDIVIATYCFTMIQVGNLVIDHPRIMPAYYVQDYEPWFWQSPFEPQQDANGWEVKFARSTYEAFNKSVFLFAKTHWTADMVMSHHNVSVHKVHPSIDHQVYYPNHTEISIKLKKTWEVSRFHVIAMIRPSTPRRNPFNTLEILLRLAYSFPNRINVTTFGCDPTHIEGILYGLESRFGPSPYRRKSILKRSNIRLMGVISNRWELAKLYRQSDVFIDASRWQAFGRAGLEAMACGAIAVMPLTGAGPEICGTGASLVKSSIMNVRSSEEGNRCVDKSHVSNHSVHNSADRRFRHKHLHNGLKRGEDCIVSHEESCLFHDGNDPVGFYAKMMLLLQDDARRRAMIIRGMEKTNHFTPEAAAASIADQLLGDLARRRKEPIRVFTSAGLK